MNGISVIVCCYNSSGRIEETLHCLLAQHIGHAVEWEILVINNASSDNTGEIIKKIEKDHSPKVQLRLMDEPLPGLIHARRKGIENARYDVLIFCDDDNHFDSRYVETAYTLLQKHPEVAIAGGWAKPSLPFYPGKWIESNYGALAIEPSPREAGYVDWVFGAGMVIRRRLFGELRDKGLALTLTGRLGSKQTSGDDAEVCFLARFLGYKIYYSPALILYHKIAANRLTKWSFVKANYRNVYMIVYFYSLDVLMREPQTPVRRIYWSFVRSRFFNLFFYLPRIFFGKNSFYSFIMFFQSFQLALWAFIRKKSFYDTYHAIKNNLYP